MATKKKSLPKAQTIGQTGSKKGASKRYSATGDSEVSVRTDDNWLRVVTGKLVNWSKSPHKCLYNPCQI